MPRKKKNSDLLEALPKSPQETESTVVAANSTNIVEPHQTFGQICNSCIVFDKCQNYKADATCSIDFRVLFTSLGRTPEAFQMSALSVLELQYERVQRAVFQEKLNAGVIDPNTSAEIGKYFDLLAEYKRMHEKTSTLSIRAEGESVGLLGKLLMGSGQANK